MAVFRNASSRTLVPEMIVFEGSLSSMGSKLEVEYCRERMLVGSRRVYVTIALR
jgi:hypothetical protein